MRSVSEGNANSEDREEAGKRISRRILTTCWNSLISQLLTTVGPHLQPAAGKSALAGFLGHSSRKGGGPGFGKGPDVRLVAGIDCLQVENESTVFVSSIQSVGSIVRPTVPDHVPAAQAKCHVKRASGLMQEKEETALGK